MPSTEPIIAVFDDAAQARRLTLVVASPAKFRGEVVDRLIDSGEPKSGDASAEGAEIVPMPTGSGTLGSRLVPSDDEDR
jgi:hypothetical protein